MTGNSTLPRSGLLEHGAAADALRRAASRARLSFSLAYPAVAPVEATKKYSNAYPYWMGNVKCEYNGKKMKSIEIVVCDEANA